MIFSNVCFPRLVAPIQWLILVVHVQQGSAIIIRRERKEEMEHVNIFLSGSLVHCRNSIQHQHCCASSEEEEYFLFSIDSIPNEGVRFLTVNAREWRRERTLSIDLDMSAYFVGFDHFFDGIVRWNFQI